MRNINVTVFLGAVAFLLVLFVMALSTKHETNSTISAPTEVTATTWSWGKLVGKPVQVTSMDSQTDPTYLSGLLSGLRQVEFQMTDMETLTAFFTCAPLLSFPSPTTTEEQWSWMNWKVDDEVLIASVGVNLRTNHPSKVYFIVGYRKKQE